MAEETLFVLVEQSPDYEGTLAQLKSKLSGEGDQQASPASRSSKLKCPRVPKKLLLDVKAQGHNVPKRISLGPYHHGHPDLAGGETLKHKLVKAFIDAFDLSVENLSNLICNDVDDLRVCYEEETAKKFPDADFKIMMLIDGCALLWYIACVSLGLDHEKYDIRNQDLNLLREDALLLENQLPYQLLQRLMKSANVSIYFWTAILRGFFGITEESSFQELLGIKEKPFLQKMKNCCCELFSVNRIVKGNPEHRPEEEWKPCHHLLDLYYRNFLGGLESFKRTRSDDCTIQIDLKNQSMVTHRNVKELMTAGIRIKRSPTGYLRDVTFTSNGITAYLRLPPITIDKSTKTLFLSLIAYEMSSDIPHDFISYLRFLDSLIDHADDVKELQSAGVLQNNLGTHEEVAEFFNTVSAELDSNFRGYKDVRVKIREHFTSHCNSKLKKWMTQCLDTYFSNPWTIIALIAASLILFLTAVQTYFSAFSPGRNR